MSFDRGILNVPLSKRGPSLDAQIDRALAEQQRQAREDEERRSAERVAAREAEKARPKPTADDVRGARFVRDSYGWHEVVRISAKSVTVKTPWSWTERIALDKVLEARK